MLEKIIMTKQNSAGSAGHRPETLIQKYGIKSTAYYRRLDFLKIKAQKDEDNKAYLTDEQVEVMDALHEYINENGKMQGFEFTPGENEVESESVTQDTDDVSETDDVNDADSSGKMTVAASGKISGTDSVIEQEIPQTQPDFSGGMEQLFREAAEIKAQNMVMPNLVKLQLASQMTFDDLPNDLKQKVEAVNEAANPKMEPVGIASQLLAQHRSSQKPGGK